MEKRVAYYTPPSTTGVWPDSFLAEFKAHVGKHGVMSFEEGTVTEEAVQRRIKQAGLEVSRRTIINVTGNDVYRYPFYYLIVQPDRDYYNVRDFLDFSTACDGGGQILCWTGVEQKKKITLDVKKSKLLDIMAVPNVLHPRIYIISRRLKDLLGNADLSGYQVIPCLEKGRNYSNFDADLEFTRPELDEDARYFQLMIKKQTSQPPRTGIVTKIFSQCSRCKAVYGFDSRTTPYFDRDALSTSDFQTFRGYTADNLGYLNMGVDAAVVSNKFLRIIIDNKLTGLTNYLTDPPIRYGVVDIH